MRSQIIVGDLAGYDRSVWELPSDLPANKIWHLQRTEPRLEKARGGKKAIVQHLAAMADAAGAWLTTEVQPHDENDEARMFHINRAYGGFVSYHPEREFEALMHRRPR